MGPGSADGVPYISGGRVTGARTGAGPDRVGRSVTATQRVGEAMATGPAVGRGGTSGDHIDTAPRSAGTIGFYVVLLLLLVYVAVLPSSILPSPLLAYFLAAVLLLFLARNLSTRYRLDPDALTAWRLFGSRRIEYDEVRKIEFANLRDLGPVSFFGSWGWRGRMWSPIIGPFDSVYTISRGLLVSAGKAPLFLSPRDPVAFARELSRRVRSLGIHLETDVGAPTAASPPAF